MLSGLMVFSIEYCSINGLMVLDCHFSTLFLVFQPEMFMVFSVSVLSMEFMISFLISHMSIPYSKCVSLILNPRFYIIMESREAQWKSQAAE